MPLYDFTCEGGHATEEIRGYGVASIPCPSCGADAPRAGFNVVSMETRAAPTEVRDRDGKVNVSRFKEITEGIDYAYIQQEKKEGHEIKAPSLYKAGVGEAKRKGLSSRRKS